MPYDRRSELPDSVKDNLPDHAQDSYKQAFKNVLLLMNTGEMYPLAIAAA